MSNPKLRLYLADDSAEASPLEYAVDGGVTSDPQDFNLWNDKGDLVDSETATELMISALSRDAGVGSFSYNHEAARDGWPEVRAVGPGGYSTPWQPVGRAKRLKLKDLPKDTKLELQGRLKPPAGVGTVHVEVLLRVHCLRVDVPLEIGHHETGARGVLTGTGDPRMSGILSGYLITPNGSPDNKTDVSTGIHNHRGKWVAIVGHELTYSNADSAAAALASGEEYPATLSVGAGSTVTVTKGPKGAAPLDPDTWPAQPDGELVIAKVRVPFDATISAGDIDQTDREVKFFGYQATGLSVTLFGGWAITDNRDLDPHRTTPLTLQASDTNYCWLHPDGSRTVDTVGTPPVDRALLLHEWDTDGSGITAWRDRRPWHGPRVWPVVLRKGGTLADGDKGYGTYPSPRAGSIRGPAGVVASVRDSGSGSASTLFDVRKKELGGSFTTIYTGAVDRPEIAFAAADPVDADSIPKVYDVGPFAQFEFELIDNAGTPGTDAEVVILVEEC
jgi:hypothetical protein